MGKNQKSEYQIDIIDRIRRLRREKEYSQMELAALLGISSGQMGNIESPRTPYKYTLEHIYKICREFHYPIDHLFLEEDDYANADDIISLLIGKIVRYERQ